MEAEIRDINEWNWEFINNTYKGIPMKHAFDMMCSVKDIQLEKECPTKTIKSYFKEFVAKGSNQLDKCTPEHGITLPSHWWDWNRTLSLEEFKSFPLKFDECGNTFSHKLCVAYLQKQSFHASEFSITYCIYRGIKS